MADTLTIKRIHGLGNVLLLLPVLEHLRDRGEAVQLLTRAEWAGPIGALVHGVDVTVLDGGIPAEAVDLDAMTMGIKPVEHRTLELARLLGVTSNISPGKYTVPGEWGRPFEHLFGCVVFAPEAGHPARQWPWSYVRELSGYLIGTPLVLTGIDPTEKIPADVDLRGKLDLFGMIGLLSQAAKVITMDSGTLHMATSLSVPAVAVFGGLNPHFRVRESQRAIVLQADLDCVPCDKSEICQGRIPCLKSIDPSHVLTALADLDRAEGLIVRRILEGSHG